MNEARLRAAADERTSVMARIDCLSDDELLALQFGILDEVALENLAGHLERCPRCEHRARACDGESDELMAALRRSRNATRNDAVAIPVPTPSTLGFLAPAQAPDELGRLGPYRVRKLLGQGGMGMVFLAEDLQLERPVALKVLLPDRAANSEARQRFVREAKAAAQLKHDHIVTIYQVGEDNGVCWLAMEYLEGESLDDWLAPGRRPNLSAILRMAREVAEGLSAAHERQLVHRDIKPANVWIERSTGRAKILDFGLARPERDDVRITTSDTIVGTPAYMSPEQAHGGNLDGRSDLFSLGCLLYELLTGQLPFRGDTAMATLMALALDPPSPTSLPIWSCSCWPNAPWIVRRRPKSSPIAWLNSKQPSPSGRSPLPPRFPCPHGRYPRRRSAPIALSPTSRHPKPPRDLTTVSIPRWKHRHSSCS
jgi:serine/threonine protein kinase